MILLLVQSALFLAVVALLIGALLVDRSGIHGRDYLVFEERAVRSQQLTVAAFVLVIVEFLVGTPLLGAVLAIIAILWTIWWLPAEHRRFDVAVQQVFDARPEAVAAVMFDISEQPRWMDSIVRTALETPGLLRKGSVIRQTLRVSGQDLVAKLVVVELVPYERLLLQVRVRHAELAPPGTSPELRGEADGEPRAAAHDRAPRAHRAPRIKRNSPRVSPRAVRTQSI